jgi:hypothetical protein
MADNPFYNEELGKIVLTDEDIIKVSEEIEKQLKSSDPAVVQQGKITKDLLLQAVEKDRQFKNCISRQDNGKGWSYEESPECVSFNTTVVYNELKDLFDQQIDTVDTCGDSTLSKIDTALLNFFDVLKSIKKYGDLYVYGTINKIAQVTNLISRTADIISSVLKILVQRIRNWLLNLISQLIQSVIDQILPTLAKVIKDTVIQKIIEAILCAFDEIINGLTNLVVDFLEALVAEIINPVFCAVNQFTNALVNNLAAKIDQKIQPLLDNINDVLGGIAQIAGSIFEAVDFILGFESFLCSKPNCPEVKKYKVGPWGGPSKSQIDSFNNFRAPIDYEIYDTVDGSLGQFFGPGSDIQTSSFTCNTNPYECGPPNVDIFGGGGIGAVGAAIVNSAGNIVGVDLFYGGQGYTFPPFVTFSDSCGSGNYASAYTVIEDGVVVDVIIVNTGSGYLNRPSGRDEFGNKIDNTTNNGVGTGTTTGTGTGTTSTVGVGTTSIQDIVDAVKPKVPKVREYVGCLKEFQILNTGIGYSINDSITLTPDIPNLKAKVKLTENGQIVGIQILNSVCNISEIPEIRINSDTGAGAKIRSIVSYTRAEKFDSKKDQNFNSQQLISVIDCIKK